MAIVGLSLIGVTWSVVQVLTEGGAPSDDVVGRVKKEVGKEVGKWEWIDVVSAVDDKLFCDGERPGHADRRGWTGLCGWIRKTGCDSDEIYSAIVGEL